MARDTRSEYEGGGVQDNTLFPKTIENMSIAERLRLQSITGQDEDPKAKPNPYFWYGNVEPEEPATIDEVALLKDPGRY